MTGEPQSDPRTSKLRQEIAHLRVSLGDLQDALSGINDPQWRDAFVEAVSVANAVVSFHANHVQPSIANDAATVRSAISRHAIPREDPDLGAFESLARLRNARGAVIADADSVLVAAEALGLRPSELSITPPTEIQFERAGFEGMLVGLEKRLGEVERALDGLRPEGEAQEGVSLQQVGIVNFFINSMSVEVALAKLEATAKALIDFAGLARAIDTMGELSRDVMATIKALPARFTEAVWIGSAVVAKRVRSVARGLRAIVHRVVARVPDPGVDYKSLSGAKDAHPAEVPDRADVDFWKAIKEGDAATRAGSLRIARDWYQAALVIAEGLIERDGDNARWQRDLSVSYDRLGDVELDSGNLSAARVRYEEGLVIAERLARQEPGNSDRQRDLSISYHKLGGVEQSAGNLGAGRERYEAGLAIAERLAGLEPLNGERQRDLSVCYDRLGEIELSAGNLEAARERHEAGLAIAERLAVLEPLNSERQRDLSVSYEKLGEIERSAGNLEAARKRHEAGLAIRERLAASDPDNSEWQRDLSVSNNKLGEVEQSAGDLGAARARHEAGLAIVERLAALEPGNSEWQRDLAICYCKLGEVEQSAGELEAAQGRYETGLTITERLTALEPGNSVWQRDLFIINAKLAQISEGVGDIPQALQRFIRAEGIMAELVTTRPDHPGFARDLAQVQWDILRLRG